MMGTIDLYQLAETGFPLAPLPVFLHPAPFVGDSCLVQPEPERFIAYGEPVIRREDLRSMDEVEIGVRLPEKPEHSILGLAGNPIVGCPTARPMADALVSLGPNALDHPPELPIAHPENLRRRNLGDLQVQNLVDKMEPLRFPSAHRDHVLVCHNALPIGRAL